MIIRPLSGRGVDIRVEYNKDDIHVHWGNADFQIKKVVIKDVKINFLRIKMRGIRWGHVSIIL